MLNIAELSGLALVVVFTFPSPLAGPNNLQGTADTPVLRCPPIDQISSYAATLYNQGTLRNRDSYLSLKQ